MKRTITFEWTTDDVFVPEHEDQLEITALQQISEQMSFGNDSGDLSAQIDYDGSNEDIDGEGLINYYGTWTLTTH